MDLSRYSHFEYQPVGLALSPGELTVLARLPAPAPPAAQSSRWMRSFDDESVAFGGVLVSMFLLLVLGPLMADIRPTAPLATVSAPLAAASPAHGSQALQPSAPRATGKA